MLVTTMVTTTTTDDDPLVISQSVKAFLPFHFLLLGKAFKDSQQFTSILTSPLIRGENNLPISKEFRKNYSHLSTTIKTRDFQCRHIVNCKSKT